MIDKVKMNYEIDIPSESFDHRQWRLTYNREQPLYIHHHNGVTICYSFNSSRLSLIGRLYNLSENPNRIGNLDLLYEGMAGIRIEQERNEDGTVRYYAESYTQDLDQLINLTNAYINNLLDISIDIRQFRVTYIEFCLNLYTPHVGEYCRMFNKVFRENPHASYTSHVKQQGLSEDSSFYIRSNAQYRDNESARYTINFYNKLDQLTNLVKQAYSSRSEFGPERFGDITSARNILRMEIQVGHLALRNLYDENGIDRIFQVFLDPLVAREIILRQYERIIGRHDSYFYSYKEALHVIDNSDYPAAEKSRIREYLLNYVRHQHAPSKNTMYRYRRLLRNIGIHWSLIPTNYNISRLESPITLLDRNISSIEENRADMAERFFITELEAKMYNDIEIEEEDVLELPDDI